VINFKFVRVGDQHVDELAYVSKCLDVSTEEALAIIIDGAYEKVHHAFDPVVAGPTLGNRIRVVSILHKSGLSRMFRGVVFKEGHAPQDTNIVIGAEDVDPRDVELVDPVAYTEHAKAYFSICEMLYYN